MPCTPHSRSPGTHHAHIRRPGGRRRHLRADDRLRRGAARALGRTGRAQRFRQRYLLQPSANDPRRPSLPADARSGRARESVRERRTLARIAPWAVRPLPFVLPLDALAHARARGHARRLPAGPSRRRPIATTGFRRHTGCRRAGSSRETKRGVRGPTCNRCRSGTAAVWYDYVTVEADRLTFAWALAAGGARRTTRQLRRGRGAHAPMPASVTGARLVDRISGESFQVRARDRHQRDRCRDRPAS